MEHGEGSGVLAGEALGGMQHWEFYYIYLQHILLREGKALGVGNIGRGWNIGEGWNIGRVEYWNIFGILLS